MGSSVTRPSVVTERMDSTYAESASGVYVKFQMTQLSRVTLGVSKRVHVTPPSMENSTPAICSSQAVA